MAEFHLCMAVHTLMTEFGPKEFVFTKKVVDGRLVSSDETSACQVSSVQASAYLDDRKLTAKHFLWARKSWATLIQ